MQRVIQYLVNHDQSGCIKNRSTSANIRSILDITNYLNEKAHTGIIAFIDYEKAFNTVNWNFVFDCLKTLNFGENFTLSVPWSQYGTEGSLELGYIGLIAPVRG